MGLKKTKQSKTNKQKKPANNLRRNGNLLNPTKSNKMREKRVSKYKVLH